MFWSRDQIRERENSAWQPATVYYLYGDSLNSRRLTLQEHFRFTVNMFQDYFADNLEDVQMTKDNFTVAVAKMTQMFTTNTYQQELVASFDVSSWSDLSDGHRTLGMQLVFHLL